MFKAHHALSTVALATVLALPGIARAEVFCVTSTAELQSALEQADSNFEDDEIRIAQGVYPVPQGAPFRFRGGAQLGGDDNDLTLVGGWISFSGNPCGRLRSDASALDTILDGEGRERVMRIDAGEQSNVTIRGLTFLDGNPSESGTTRGGGLYLTSFGDTAGVLTVERSAFVANRATFSAAVNISASRTIRFISNLATGNIAGNSTSVVDLIQSDQNGIYAINNTIINNLSDGAFSNAAATGLRVSVDGSSQALVANNILWGNEYRDMDYSGNGFISSRNNTIESSLGSADSNQGNLSIAPVFESGGFLEFNLVPESPLANAGLNPPRIPLPIFESNWSLPDRDLAGEPRLTNDTVDIGAFETAQDGIFSDRFE